MELFSIEKEDVGGETIYFLKIGGMIINLSEVQAEKMVDTFAALGVTAATAPRQIEPATLESKPDPSLAYLEAALQIQGQHIQDLRDQIQDARAFIQILVNRGLKAAPTKRFDNV